MQSPWPYALLTVGIEPRDVRYADHLKVNEVLKEATAPVDQSIEKLYAPGLRLIARAAGPMGKEIASFDIEKARQHAWVCALALDTAKTDFERAAVDTMIEQSSAVLAKVILSPTHQLPFLLPLLRHIEDLNPWWLHLIDPDDAATQVAH